VAALISCKRGGRTSAASCAPALHSLIMLLCCSHPQRLLPSSVSEGEMAALVRLVAESDRRVAQAADKIHVSRHRNNLTSRAWPLQPLLKRRLISLT